MKIHLSDLRVGRVVSEDSRTMLLEVVKDEDAPLTLDPDGTDRFLTLLFVRRGEGDDGAATAEIWTPWEDDDAAEA